MKVNSLLRNLAKLKLILEIYRDKSLDEMLDDIYAKITASVITKPVEGAAYQAERVEISAPTKVRNKKRPAEPFEPGRLAALLPDMKKDDIAVFLKQYTKQQILEIAAVAPVKVRKSYDKGTIIQYIANHYGYIQLDQDIAKRPSY
ncbi:MAG: hypothetical protein PHZ03_10835 [Syntrophomonas sp.]|nr:hypothetical protein [Syntrophomonas sp.]